MSSFHEDILEIQLFSEEECIERSCDVGLEKQPTSKIVIKTENFETSHRSLMW